MRPDTSRTSVPASAFKALPTMATLPPAKAMSVTASSFWDGSIRRPPRRIRSKGIASSLTLLAKTNRLLALVDVPEDRRCRTIEHAAQRLAPGARLGELPKRDIDHLLVSLLLDFGCDLLLLLG